MIKTPFLNYCRATVSLESMSEPEYTIDTYSLEDSDNFIVKIFKTIWSLILRVIRFILDTIDNIIKWIYGLFSDKPWLKLTMGSDEFDLSDVKPLDFVKYIGFEACEKNGDNLVKCINTAIDQHKDLLSFVDKMSDSDSEMKKALDKEGPNDSSKYKDKETIFKEMNKLFEPSFKEFLMSKDNRPKYHKFSPEGGSVWYTEVFPGGNQFYVYTIKPDGGDWKYDSSNYVDNKHDNSDGPRYVTNIARVFGNSTGLVSVDVIKNLAKEGQKVEDDLLDKVKKFQTGMKGVSDYLEGLIKEIDNKKSKGDGKEITREERELAKFLLSLPTSYLRSFYSMQLLNTVKNSAQMSVSLAKFIYGKQMNKSKDEKDKDKKDEKK